MIESEHYGVLHRRGRPPLMVPILTLEQLSQALMAVTRAKPSKILPPTPVVVEIPFGMPLEDLMKALRSAMPSEDAETTPISGSPDENPPPEGESYCHSC